MAIAYDFDGFADALEDTMRRHYPALLEASHEEANRRYDLGISWDVSNPQVKKTINRLAKRIRGVSDTVKDNARGVLDRGLEAGLSTTEIARQLREYGVTDSKSRSEMISRTETATAYSLGSILAYEQAGVEKVEVLDSDDDPECAEANGQIWTLEEAEANPLAHPHCVRAFAPVVE